MDTGKFAEGTRICPSHAMGLSLFWKFEQSSSPRPKNMPPTCFCPAYAMGPGKFAKGKLSNHIYIPHKKKRHSPSAMPLAPQKSACSASASRSFGRAYTLRVHALKTCHRHVFVCLRHRHGKVCQRQTHMPIACDGPHARLEDRTKFGSTP